MKPGTTTSIGRLEILEIDRQFPGISTRNLARIVIDRHPLLFKDFRSAYRTVQKMRNGSKSTGEQPKPEMSKSSFLSGGILVGKTHFDEKPWEPLQVLGPCSALILPDVHTPFHWQDALMRAVEYGMTAGVDLVLFNGDFWDCHAGSRWEQDIRKRDLQFELDTGRMLLRTIREAFPKARLIYKLGNHEERWETYLISHPELLGVKDFQIESLLRLQEVDCEIVRDKRPIRLGDLNVIHGHEYRFAISNPVNPARGLFLKAKAYAMCSHFHQPSHHPDRTIEGKNVSCWSTGCLCDLHPRWLPINSWSHGFAVVKVDETGKFRVENKFISGGLIY